MNPRSASPPGQRRRIMAGVFLALGLILAGAWGHAVWKERDLARYVETVATWTRFDTPVKLRWVKGGPDWVVPARFSYRVGENDFTGLEKMDLRMFERRAPKVGDRFRVWYDPEVPSDVVRSLHGPAADAWLTGWATLISVALAALCGASGLRPRGRSWSRGGSGFPKT
jgi:hypothetical protein